MTRPLAAIVAASVALRVVAALAMGDAVAALPGVHDQLSYDALARRVLAGHGLSFATPGWPATAAGAPTAHWSFLYTGFLALVYAVSGSHALVARLIQAVAVGVLLPWGLYRLGERTLGRPAGLWAAALGAVYAYFVYYAAALMTEAFTIVALVWLLALAVDVVDRPTRRGWIAFGLVAAAAVLLRQVTAPVIAVLGLWIVWRAPSRRGALRGLALAAAIVACLVAPITLRNARVFGRFVALNTNAGYAFFWANHPVHGTDFQGILPDDGPRYEDLIPPDLRGADEAALDAALLRRGLGFVAADPGRYLVLSLSRLEDYFRFWPLPDSSRASNLARVLSFGLLLPAMLAGLVLSRHARRACEPLYLFIGAYTLIHLLSWALIRYRLPVDAVLLVFAGLALDRAVKARLPGRSPLGGPDAARA